MKATYEPPPSTLPSAAVPTEIRLLGELNSLRARLDRLTQTMERVAEALERVTNGRRW